MSGTDSKTDVIGLEITFFQGNLYYILKSIENEIFSYDLSIDLKRFRLNRYVFTEVIVQLAEIKK